MNVPVALKIDKASFYDFVVKHDEGRYEYERGRIVQQMTGGTLAHMRIVQRLVSLFESQLNPESWIVTSQGRGVETAESVRYPDVVVEQAGADVDGLVADHPVLIVGVLSATSTQRDLGLKPAEYMSLATLAAYIVANQNGPECFVWLRDANGVFADQPRKIEGYDSIIELPAPRVRFSLADIYRGIREP